MRSTTISRDTDTGPSSSRRDGSQSPNGATEKDRRQRLTTIAQDSNAHDPLQSMPGPSSTHGRLFRLAPRQDTASSSADSSHLAIDTDSPQTTVPPPSYWPQEVPPDDDEVAIEIESLLDRQSEGPQQPRIPLEQMELTDHPSEESSSFRRRCGDAMSTPKGKRTTRFVLVGGILVQLSALGIVYFKTDFFQRLSEGERELSEQ